MQNSKNHEELFSIGRILNIIAFSIFFYNPQIMV